MHHLNQHLIACARERERERLERERGRERLIYIWANNLFPIKLVIIRICAFTFMHGYLLEFKYMY